MTMIYVTYETKKMKMDKEIKNQEGREEDMITTTGRENQAISKQINCGPQKTNVETINEKRK